MRVALALWSGVLLALELQSWPQAFALALVLLILIIGILRKEWRVFTALLLVAISLVQLREVGERLTFKQNAIRFEIIARGDADLLPQRIYGSIEQEASCSFRAESRRLGLTRRQVPLRVITDDCSVFFGEAVEGVGRLRPSKEQRVAGTLIIDEITHRYSNVFWKRLDVLRKRYRSLFGERGDAGSLVPGMVIGDTALQSEEFDATMRLAGLSHLTAVSGANFSIVATVVMWLVSLRIKTKRLRLLITASTLALFAVVVRPSPSVLRAGVMAAVVLYAQLRGNQRSSLLALSGAVTLLLLIDPYQGLDAGFALSVLATFGIIVIAPQITEWLMKNWNFPKVIAEVIAIPIAATILCSPVVIAISGKLSFASVPLNMIAAPLVPIVTLSGFAALLFIPLARFTTLFPAEFLGFIAHLSAWPIAGIARWSHSAPIIEMPFGFFGGALFIIAAAAVLFAFKTLRSSTHRIAGILALALLMSMTFFTLSGARNWQLYQCDVGQGDALLIRTSKASAMVVDVGPEPSRVDRCLRMAGVKTISLLVISHLHADHYGGISGAVRGRAVHRWWIAPDHSPQSIEIVSELQTAIGIAPEYVRSGSQFRLDPFAIRVLWPDVEKLDTPRLDGDGSEQNNRSIALLIESDDVSIFTAGDIEPYAQEEIIQRHDLSTVDIYKVSHHGSALRSQRYDEILNPAVALISVGKSNPYGHPAPEAIGALAPARIFRTDRDGSLRLTWWPIRVH